MEKVREATYQPFDKAWDQCYKTRSNWISFRDQVRLQSFLNVMITGIDQVFPNVVQEARDGDSSI